MTELAKISIEDGQLTRAVHNYLADTFDDIFGNEFQGGLKFTDRISFYSHLKDSVLPLMIESYEAEE